MLLEVKEPVKYLKNLRKAPLPCHIINCWSGWVTLWPRKPKEMAVNKYLMYKGIGCHLNLALSWSTSYPLVSPCFHWHPIHRPTLYGELSVV